MLRNITLHTFDQLRSIIDQLNPHEYQASLDILGGSSIGQHVRHILEFYICLSDSLDSGVVNYDARKRDCTLSECAKTALMLVEYLNTLFYDARTENRVLVNIIEYNGEVLSANSSFERELIYLIEHNIHHFAIINIAIKENFSHIAIPQGFGVAYSTIKHQEAACHH